MATVWVLTLTRSDDPHNADVHLFGSESRAMIWLRDHCRESWAEAGLEDGDDEDGRVLPASPELAIREYFEHFDDEKWGLDLVRVLGCPVPTTGATAALGTEEGYDAFLMEAATEVNAVWAAQGRPPLGEDALGDVARHLDHYFSPLVQTEAINDGKPV